jgi:2,3-bisphosphoglycerate-independent phosphoglycerate mutase
MKLLKKKNLPLILVILDGWGYAPSSPANAIALAKTPNFDSYIAKYPNTLLGAAGRHVGLPKGQEGNSEAGHMNIGAGRIAEQDAVRINKTIDDGTFFKNPAFMEAIQHAKNNKKEIHLMGLLATDMSAHVYPRHLEALIDLLKKSGIKRINLHLFTDGRDSPAHEAINLIRKLESKFTGQETINTIMGRFYAMDRKKYWPRTEMTYNALVMGAGKTCAFNPEAVITQSYNQGVSDEYIEPTIICSNGKMTPRISDGDSVIFFNLRSDRARQIAKAFVQDDFNQHNPGAFIRRKVLKDIRFVAMTDFGPDLDSILSAFPSPDLDETLPMELKGLRQLYIAETEKYAHVTFFMNGGFADTVAGEERTVIPSPNVDSYDKVPAMSSIELTYEILSNLKQDKYDFTCLNFAAPDMIGHTGNLKAAIECCEVVDKQLGKIVDAYLGVNGVVLVTADHGNIEQMINPKTGEPDTEHTTNPVPFIIIGKEAAKIKLEKDGVLADIAPTILDLLGIPKTKLMNRKSLIIKK